MLTSLTVIASIPPALAITLNFFTTLNIFHIILFHMLLFYAIHQDKSSENRHSTEPSAKLIIPYSWVGFDSDFKQMTTTQIDFLL